MDQTSNPFADIGDMETFYERVAPYNLGCGWRSEDRDPGGKTYSSPYPNAHWKYADVRPALDAAAKLISAEDAGRRILMCVNPVEGGGKPGIGPTLFHAYQMVLPGETAPSHRHPMHALRVILDATKMYSVVEGEKTLMETGDVVLTPGGMYHSHIHDGDDPAYWLDGLDAPFTRALHLVIFEPHPDVYEPVKVVAEVSPFRFSWSDIQTMLDKAEDDPEGYFPRRVRLDTSTMPTLGAYVQRLEAGQTTRMYRTNANTSFAPMQGSGVSIIEGEEIHWNRGDVFAAPTWRWIEHLATRDSVLFTMTDAPLLKFAKYYKFEGS
ncbi:MAG: cupin domain-containing protein [Rhodospirillaceae bacterium]|jgi:gentisate 1,2-dioxygenase|nr:cupin domain-containing protein [Rhodospirillaceae bacterium]MBT4117337.1 cupin domain-containing protein [Rhodospirillaceae bacterium]MBT4672621.1 cupin domain-containing protein [Rhodospirillaceae bacterium]MBT6861058.1 cupin domain-containing protein [Rhodospirillaceae bacterium]MBT7031000.1 cupin domain-containing protein [Rhodospirillaceae bacterium]